METYIVVLRHPITDDIAEKADGLSEGQAYRLSDHVLLIRSFINTPLPIRKHLGIDKSREGVAFKLKGSYSGYEQRSLWEWIDEGKEAGA